MISAEMIVTIGVLVVALGLIVLCRIKLKQPPDPKRVRLVPYGAIMMIMSFVTLLALAHTVSLVTGKQLVGKTTMKGQR